MADSKLRVQLIGDSSRLTGSLNTASARLSKFGKKISSIGASMQRFALPLAIAGGAAIKMGVDFDKSMTKIKSLVGVAGDTVDEMGKKARQMAVDTGVSSTKAADALFFITSAGLRGEQAMDVLNASLKASAVGLGEVSQIADLATSAMNAYGSDTLSASGATDVLVAAVREGKLSSEELAGSMGSVLPTASALGVSFNDVGAAMAAMSRTGTDAAQGATQLNAILMGITKTGPAQDKAFKEMGLSAAGLRQQIKEEGLLAALGSLKKGIDGNTEAATQIFPNIRALKGVLDLTGKGAADNAIIFKNMSNVLGDTQKSFDKTSESASFKLTKGLNQAKESFAQMGAVLLETLLPVILQFAGFITKLFTAFNKLDGSTQTFIAALGVLAITLPTILTLFGSLLTAIAAMTGPIGLTVLAIAGIGTAFYTQWDTVSKILVKFYNGFVDLYNGSEMFRAVISVLEAAFKIAFIRMKTGVDQLINSFQTVWAAVKAFANDESVGDALQQGFDKGKDIAKQAGEDIADTMADALAKTINGKLEKKTVEQLNASISNIASKAKGLISSAISGGSSGGGGGGGDKKESKGLQSAGIQSVGMDPVSVMTQSMKDNKPALDAELAGIGASLSANLLINQEKMLAFKEIGLQMGESIKGTFTSMGASISESLGAGETALGTFAGVLIQSAMTALGASLATTMGFGAEAAGNTAKSMGPAAAFVLPALLAGAAVAVKGAFKKVEKPKKFAAGGIVSTPTMGLMGEYPGARSNPEVIAPLDKLKGMIDGRGGQSVQVGGSFTLKGQDLVVALQRANNQRNRIT
tara:strand:+ start:1166 stop:3598 length:2433 start_codon:yes stop_codon:yes gene_type:complete